jgi:hypothetical protein
MMFKMLIQNLQLIDRYTKKSRHEGSNFGKNVPHFCTKNIRSLTIYRHSNRDSSWLESSSITTSFSIHYLTIIRVSFCISNSALLFFF